MLLFCKLYIHLTIHLHFQIFKSLYIASGEQYWYLDSMVILFEYYGLTKLLWFE